MGEKNRCPERREGRVGGGESYFSTWIKKGVSGRKLEKKGGLGKEHRGMVGEKNETRCLEGGTCREGSQLSSNSRVKRRAEIEKVGSLRHPKYQKRKKSLKTNQVLYKRDQGLGT